MQILPSLTKINFIGGRKVAAVLSSLLIVASLYSLVTNELNYGIDFSGGTKIELGYEQEVAVAEIRGIMQQGGYTDSVVQYFGSNRDVLIRLPLSEQNSSAEISSDIVAMLAASNLGKAEVLGVEFVGPTFGKELFEKGILALVYALIGVMIYVAFRFEWKFSLGSVAACLLYTSPSPRDS